jgi:hypothetical protein
MSNKSYTKKVSQENNHMLLVKKPHTRTNKLLKNMNTLFAIADNARKTYGTSPQLETSNRNIICQYNTYLNKNIILHQLCNDNELKMFRLIKIRVDEMMTDIACRIDNHKFVYDNGHIINNRDRMRLRMIIGTLHTFYTNYKHIIANTKMSIYSALQPYTLNFDVIGCIIGFL